MIRDAPCVARLIVHRTFVDGRKGLLNRPSDHAAMLRIVVAALAAFAVFDLCFQNGMYTYAVLLSGVSLVHRVVTGY
ncbi:MAG TPA: hypothetical protein VNU65_04395 [Xanthobacteraceae bacterium]|jgi:hypothetical protein|nr:hypothetical protein [Xanthobacteraceae bacterium]